MKKNFLYIFLLIFSAAGTIVADAQNIYPFCKKVTDESATGTLPAIRLDSELYEQLNSDYSNLRIFDAENKPVPFVRSKLYQWGKKSSYMEVPGKIVDFSFDPKKNEAVIEYEITRTTGDIKLGKLEIDPKTNRRFNKVLTIEFDNKYSEKQNFFNHTGRVDFSRHSFTFAPQQSTRIKLRIHPFAEQHDSSTLEHSGKQDSFTEKRIFSEELNIDRIAFFAVQEEVIPVQVQTSVLSNVEVKKIPSTPRQSEWEFKLSKHPVAGLSIKSSTANYRRNYQLHFFRETASGKELITAFSGDLAPGFKLSELKNIRPDSATLTIFNNDDAELENCTFEFIAPVEALLLDPQSRKLAPFTLYYGGNDSNRANYDLKSYINKFDGQSYALLTLHARQNNSLYSSVQPEKWQTILQKFLPYLIGTTALLLGFFSIRMLKKIKVEPAGE